MGLVKKRRSGAEVYPVKGVRRLLTMRVRRGKQKALREKRFAGLSVVSGETWRNPTMQRGVVAFVLQPYAGQAA